MITGPESGVYLSFYEQRTLDVASQVLGSQLTIEQAAVLLQKSTRQVRRIVARIGNMGSLGVKHGNCGRRPANKLPDDRKRFVLDLLRDQFFDFNLAHFREKLRAEHSIEIKRETLRRWAGAEGLIKRARSRKRRPRSHKTRPRLPRVGMLLQMDGSRHRWFGKDGIESCLIGAIDDASSLCPHAELFPAEDTLSVLSALKSIVEKVGVPEVLYVDQAGHFGKRFNRVIYLNWQEHLTQVERAMQELGCRMLFASSPQAKGRIERMWNTFQDRLIPELRVAGINRIPAANEFLSKQFVPAFNQRFAVKPQQKKTAFKPIPKIWADRLDWVFSIREFRRVSLGETVSWNGRTYLVCNNYGLTLKRHTIEIRTNLKGETQAFFAGRPIGLTDIGSTQFLNLKAA